ncbi:zf-HC2 domain-containing protein [Saccharopolyspora mangrovi]|uniref:Zf-HC2 domain-containing protein n=1 Tax=Saccharopolyspora mangrovi TaxID=3082379 RepID=A0ABU6A5I7_9PSEU|nr:zf-HC2 domain-containing protein [Saccharopolyspora sp. S2-29]MEB3366834.1 zf-HC2 domain-containing protein [Saccharopolyspora sp. S2-29]
MHDTDHREFQNRLNAYAAGELDDVDWLMMRTHLADCGDCQADLRRPQLWNRAAPQRILADHDVPSRSSARESAPRWTVILGIVTVATLVAFGIGYALGGI